MQTHGRSHRFWPLFPFAVALAASGVGCNGEVELRYVNVEGYEPGVKYHSDKNGYRLHGVVGPAGEITIEYKGEVVAHETGLIPGEEFEMYVDDPVVVQVPAGVTLASGLARSESTGVAYPLAVYDLSEFVPNRDGRYTAEPGHDLLVLGYDLDVTPDGPYTIELTFAGMPPGQHVLKWSLAALVTSAGQKALFPLEPLEYDFAAIQSWPYAYDVHVVRPEVTVLDSAAGKPDPADWQYVRIELEGAARSQVDVAGIRATHDSPGGATFWVDPTYAEWEDVDGDQIEEVVVRFSRSELANALPAGANRLRFEGDLWSAGWNGWESTQWLRLDAGPMDVAVVDPEFFLEPGGALDWTFDVEIGPAGPVFADFWYDIRMPDGSTVVWPQFLGLKLAPGFRYVGPWSIPVPPTVPAGTYRFDTVFGDLSTGEVYAADGFGALGPTP